MFCDEEEHSRSRWDWKGGLHVSVIPRGEREGSSRRFMPGSLARISLKYWLMEEITNLWTSNDFVLQASSRSVRNLGRRWGLCSSLDEQCTFDSDDIKAYFSCRILLSSSSRALPCWGRVNSLPSPRPLSPGLMAGGGKGRFRLLSLAMSNAAICSIFFTPASTTTTPLPRFSTFRGTGEVLMATWEIFSMAGFFCREAFFLGGISLKIAGEFSGLVLSSV